MFDARTIMTYNPKINYGKKYCAAHLTISVHTLNSKLMSHTSTFSWIQPLDNILSKNIWNILKWTCKDSSLLPILSKQIMSILYRYERIPTWMDFGNWNFFIYINVVKKKKPSRYSFIFIISNYHLRSSFVLNSMR